jgi:general secretion pathway protein C
MRLDAVFKRYFTGVICLLIACAAYFQAYGMGQLVASSAALDPSSLPSGHPQPPHGTPAAAQGSDHTTEASGILGRNPFDSITGPISPDGGLETLTLPIPPAPEDGFDWYRDPPCDHAKVLLIAASDDPQWSFADIVGPDGKAILRRQGDEVGTYAVTFIGDVRSEERRRADTLNVYDRVWMTSTTGARCQLEVGAKAPRPVPKPSGSPSATKPGDKSNVVAAISAKIHKISATQFDVERSAIDMILENQGELMKSARIVPVNQDGKVAGVRLLGIRPDSLLSVLGLENGDQLSSINGFEMSDPQKALEAYAKLRTADHLTVAVTRKGQPTNIDFSIK